jgi:hypothetical protein
MDKKALLVMFAVGLFFVSGCKGGEGGAVITPFLGGNTGVVIDFIEGNPPAEVYDGGSFDFDVLVSLRNDGEFDIPKEDIKVSLQGIRPEDFGSYVDAMIDKHPDEDLIGRSRDAEGNIIEGVPIYIEFPEGDDEHLNFIGELVGDRKEFTIRADVCYRYQTKGMAQYCVLRNLIDVRDDAICDPSESKPIYSSGAPVQLSNFRQAVAGKDKIRFTFDIVHMGNGNVFEYGSYDSQAADCPADPSKRRRKENRVKVTVEPGLGSLSCSGLEGNTGFVRLVNGKTTVICTLALSSDRTDFEKELKITIDYNYEDDKDVNFIVLSQ